MVHRMNTKELTLKKRGFITGAAVAAVAGGVVAGSSHFLNDANIDALKNSLKDGATTLSEAKINDLSSIEKAFDQEKFAQNAKLGYKTAGTPFGENVAAADVTACCCCCPCCSTAAAVTKTKGQ